MDIVMQTELPGLPPPRRGKVRDIYDLGEHLLLVVTDRVSAFDVILPNGIPGKGRILTEISIFWFRQVEDIIENHLVATDVRDFPEALQKHRSLLEGRSVLVKKTEVLPVECIVRGYISGSGWKSYRKEGTVCGIPLPAGLQLAQELPQPIYTPSTKAALGAHDENIDFAQTASLIGLELAEQVRDTAIRIYGECSAYARERGIIIADTKFEFGLDAAGRLHLIDEVLTPDSSRFWPADQYRSGISPPSFDKQFVRDYLETLDWDKTAPGPELPQEIIEKTATKYREAERRLTGRG